MLVQFILKIKITIMKAKIFCKKKKQSNQLVDETKSTLKDYNLYLRLALLSLARD